MKQNKSILALLSIAMVCLISTVAAFTGAWFTDTKSAGSATITVGNAVTIKTTSTLDDSDVMPGAKDVSLGAVTATADTGTSTMYIRALVNIQGEVANLFTITSAGTNWQEYDGYFYYAAAALTSSSKMQDLKSVAAGASTDELTLKATVSEDATEETLAPGTTVTCEIIFQAIQVENLGTKTIDSMKTAWGDLPAQPDGLVYLSSDWKTELAKHITLNTITSIKFTSSTYGLPATATCNIGATNTNLSATNNTVEAYVDGTDVTIYSAETIYLTDCKEMFSGWTSATTIYLSNINTSKVTDMSYMFYNCTSWNDTLFDIWFDVSNVTNFSYMFANCSALAEVRALEWVSKETATTTNMMQNCTFTILLNDSDTGRTAYNWFRNVVGYQYAQINTGGGAAD